MLFHHRSRSVFGATVFMAIVFLFQTGCATMFSNAPTEITFTSEPPGVDVFKANGTLLGKTPIRVMMPKEANSPVLEFRKEGYQTSTLKPERDLDGTTFFNLGFITTTSGAPSFGIDALSGGMFKYKKNSYVIRMDRISGRADSATDAQAFRYVMNNAVQIQTALAGSDQPPMSALCDAFARHGAECVEFQAAVLTHRDSLLSAEDSLELYRLLNRLSGRNEAPVSVSKN